MAGSVDLVIIDTHRRWRELLKSDYEILEQHLSTFSGIMVLPNVLTEISKILGYHDESEHTSLLQHLREIIFNNTDLLVKSVEACTAEEFSRFGLCDSVMLTIASPSR